MIDNVSRHALGVPGLCTPRPFGAMKRFRPWTVADRQAKAAKSPLPPTASDAGEPQSCWVERQAFFRNLRALLGVEQVYLQTWSRKRPASRVFWTAPSGSPLPCFVATLVEKFSPEEGPGL